MIARSRSRRRAPHERAGVPDARPIWSDVHASISVDPLQDLTVLGKFFHKTKIRRHGVAEAVAIRQVSELQSNGAEIVAEAKEHPIELRRYGETVAYVISPDRHARLQQLEEAAQRAYWGFVIARGLKSLEEGRVTEWDEATDRRLRAMFLGT